MLPKSLVDGGLFADPLVRLVRILAWSQRLAALVPDRSALEDGWAIPCPASLAVCCDSVHDTVNSLAEDLDLAFDY